MELDLPDLFSESAGMVAASDRPYYNNLLALQCQIPYARDRDLRADAFVRRFIKNWNFDRSYDTLQDERFGHEFSHILLEMTFPMLQKNPFPFDFGYNGNTQAESVVLVIENLLYNPPKIEFMDGDRFAGMFEDYYTPFEKNADRRNQALAQRDVAEGRAKTVFEARRHRKFNNTLGNAAHMDDIPVIAYDDLVAIWDIVEPFFRMLETKWNTMDQTTMASLNTWRAGMDSWLRQIKIRDLHDCLHKKDGVGPSFQPIIPSP